LPLRNAPLSHRLAHAWTQRRLRAANLVWRAATSWNAPASGTLEIGNCLLELDPSLPGDRLIYRGQWELLETHVATKLATGASVCIDVGANIGYFTMHLAQVAAQVYAFEPAPPALVRLRQAVVHAKNIEVLPFAVGANDDEWGRLHVGGGDAACSTLRPLHDLAPSFDVPIVTLDRFCEERGITNIDFMKVDVEGWEPHVLAGAGSLINRCAIGAMAVEVHPAFTDRQWVREFLRRPGYNALGLSDSARIRHQPSLGDPLPLLEANRPFTLLLVRKQAPRHTHTFA
jgi:FkbM family methyltransferase